MKWLCCIACGCITDWAERYPIHAVMQWSGRSDISTTQRYYTQVGDGIYDQAAFFLLVKQDGKAAENEKQKPPVGSVEL